MIGESGSSAAIVGAAQVVQRPGEVSLEEARSPIELTVDAARAPAADAGVGRLLGKVGFVGVAGGWFRYRNPGQLIAERIGVAEATTALTAISGTSPQDLVGVAAERIARGELDVALVVGGKARWSEQRIKRAGGKPSWTVEPGTDDPEMFGGLPASMMSEGAVFGGAPAADALFEDRLRVSAGSDVAARRQRIAHLCAAFSAVAAGNPYSWDRRAHSAEEIREATPENRMIAFPYTEAMVANNTVDMATAILLCSVEAARDAGVPADRLVFLHAVASAHETWMVAEGRRLDGAPGLAAAAAFECSGLGIDYVEHVDLYACFLSIVEMSAAALGLGSDRELTVTGGLGFAGAPVGYAVWHSIATMVERVRAGALGLVHGNGGQATKQSFAIYSSQPPIAFAKVELGLEWSDVAALHEGGVIP